MLVYELTVLSKKFISKSSHVILGAAPLQLTQRSHGTTRDELLIPAVSASQAARF